VSDALKKLTAAVKKRAMDTIRIVAHSVQAEEKLAISYSELGVALGLTSVPGVGHRPYLEAATLICHHYGLPDVAVSVVTQDSLLLGVPMPSDDVFDEQEYWSSSKIYRHQLANEQRRVRNHDWLSDKRLWPKGR
jgi:hypothetical protein